MHRQKVLVVGLGEVGKALYEIIKESDKFDVYGFDLDKEKERNVLQWAFETTIPDKIDIMHVCYRYFDKSFVATTLEYADRFNPKLVIINSTVAPLTVREIVLMANGVGVVHSPIRGMHTSEDSMKKDIRFWTKYVASYDKDAANQAADHFQQLGLKTKILTSPIETELAKLAETTYRAHMIAFFQEYHRICRSYGAKIDEVVDMLDDEQNVNHNKPVHYPDEMGGHCLIPNTEILVNSTPSHMIEQILESNKKRKEEIKNPEIREDVAKVKALVEKSEDKHNL